MASHLADDDSDKAGLEPIKDGLHHVRQTNELPGKSRVANEWNGRW